MPELHRANIALDLIIREWRLGIRQEAQYFVFVSFATTSYTLRSGVSPHAANVRATVSNGGWLSR